MKHIGTEGQTDTKQAIYTSVAQILNLKINRLERQKQPSSLKHAKSN